MRPWAIASIELTLSYLYPPGPCAGSTSPGRMSLFMPIGTVPTFDRRFGGALPEGYLGRRFTAGFPQSMPWGIGTRRFLPLNVSSISCKEASMQASVTANT